MPQTHCGEAEFVNHRIVRWAPGATQGSVVAGVDGPGSGLHQLDGPSQVLDCVFLPLQPCSCERVRTSLHVSKLRPGSLGFLDRSARRRLSDSAPPRKNCRRYAGEGMRPLCPEGVGIAEAQAMRKRKRPNDHAGAGARPRARWRLRQVRRGWPAVWLQRQPN